MLKKKIVKRTIIIAIAILFLLNIVAIIGVNIAYNTVFSRCETADYNTDYFYTYDEIDTTKYSREELSISSGENILDAFLYNTESTKGIIVVSPGHRDYSDIKLPEIMNFVDNGWMVLCYDYTGCYGSTGSDMVGYTQASTDIDAVLTYIEDNRKFDNLPVMLFGHSLGAYASTAILQNKHNVTAVVAASGFDNPTEQWNYSIRRYTGAFGIILSPYANLIMKMKFGDRAYFSAIDGINSTEIPVLVIAGTTDEYYGDVSSLYAHRESITNPNCKIQLMNDENHHGHYDYFLTDEAVEYQNRVKNGEVTFPIDKFLYMEHDNEMMNDINQFYFNAINECRVSE